MNQRKKGFTLMEMLIVVAIIGILVAVSIPVFTSQLKKTKEAVCMANRRSAKGVLAVLAMTEPEALGDIEKDGTYTWETVKKVLAESGHPFDDKICPSNGKITVRKAGESYVFMCAVHDESKPSGMDEASDILKKTSEQAAGLGDYDFLKKYVEVANANGGVQKADINEVLKYFDDPTKTFGKIPNDRNLVWAGMRAYFKDENSNESTAHDFLVVTTEACLVPNNQGKPAIKGYLFYYEGNYYRSTNTTGSGNYNFAQLNVTSTSSNSFEDFIKGRWELVE